MLNGHITVDEMQSAVNRAKQNDAVSVDDPPNELLIC